MQAPVPVFALLALVAAGVAVPLLLRSSGEMFGLPPTFFAGFLLVRAVAALVYVIRRAFG